MQDFILRDKLDGTTVLTVKLSYTDCAVFQVEWTGAGFRLVGDNMPDEEVFETVTALVTFYGASFRSSLGVQLNTGDSADRRAVLEKLKAAASAAEKGLESERRNERTSQGKTAADSEQSEKQEEALAQPGQKEIPQPRRVRRPLFSLDALRLPPIAPSPCPIPGGLWVLDVEDADAALAALEPVHIIPGFKEAQSAIVSLRQVDLFALSALRAPSRGLRNACEALIILVYGARAVGSRWREARTCFARTAAVVAAVQTVDPAVVPRHRVLGAEARLVRSSVTFDDASAGAFGHVGGAFFNFVHAAITDAAVAYRSLPKKARHLHRRTKTNPVPVVLPPLPTAKGKKGAQRRSSSM